MAEKIFFDKRLPLAYRDSDNFIGSGCNGSVYRISDNKIFKFLGDVSACEKNFEYLLSQTSSSFVFPDILVYLDNKLVGYIAKYIDGVSLKKINDEVLFEEFLDASVILEKEIRKKSMDLMSLFDMNSNNILWSVDKKLQVVDTDLYEYDNSFYEEHQLYFENMANYNETVLYSFLDTYNFFLGNEPLDKYYKLCFFEGRMAASKFLCFLVNYLESMTSNPIKTIGDVKRSLSLVRKR